MRIDDIPCEVLEVPGAQNVRDIGGYIGQGGRAVNKRRFLRAGGMHALTPQGVEAVRALDVGCILDLRSTFEVERMPDTLREDRDIAYIHIPMLDYIQSEMAGGKTMFPDSMAEMYIGLLDRSGEEYLAILRALADPAHRTMLFHCTAGKDRTGLVAMLLLGLAGVSRADIVADYVPSERLFTDGPIHPDLPRYLFSSAAETMEAALDHLDERYGGIRGYLRHIGVDDALEQALLDKLLGPRYRIKRTEDGVSWSGHGEGGSIGMIGAHELDEGAFTRWCDFCADRVTARPHTIPELIAWLRERYDLEPLPADDRRMRMQKASLIISHRPELLHNQPPQFSMDMSDEELERHLALQRYQLEEAENLSAETAGLRLRGFRLPDTERNRALHDRGEEESLAFMRKHYQETRERDPDNAERMNPDNPDAVASLHRERECFLFFEETTGSILSAEGAGCGPLMRELGRYYGVSQADIDARSPRFHGYIHMLAEQGELPTLRAFLNQEKESHGRTS